MKNLSFLPEFLQKAYVFQGIEAFANLPYFQKDEEGNLVISPQYRRPVIDMHTHLCMAFVLPLRVDMAKTTEEVQYYLPADAKIDLHKYQSHNIPNMKKVKRDLTIMTLTKRGMRATHTSANMLRDMDRMGIEKSLILAIDYPILSKNSEYVLQQCQKHSRFVGYGSVHPLSRGVEKKLDRLVELGAKGVKMHPSVQLIRPDHPKAIRLYRLCAERNLPVFFHCGPVGVEPYISRRRCRLIYYQRALEKCLDTVFILGHSGALELEKAIELEKLHPRVYYEICGPGLRSLRKLLLSVSLDRIFYGTDWPFYHQSIQLSKVFITTEDFPNKEEVRDKILYENAKNFLENYLS